MATTQPALLAFHSQQAIKDEYLYRIAVPRPAGNRMAERTGPALGEPGDWSGFSVAGLVQNDIDPYGAAEVQLGVPRILAQLLDAFSVKVSAERQPTWPGQFLHAIPTGANLAEVWPRLVLWLLVAEPGVIRFAQTAGQRAAIQAIGARYQSVLDGEEVSARAWDKARGTADAVGLSHPATTAALNAIADAMPDCFEQEAAYTAATTTLNADLDLAHAYGAALAADRARHAAVVAADAATTQDTSAASVVEIAVSAATLVTTPVAVAEAANFIAVRYAIHRGCYRGLNKEYHAFIMAAAAGYYDDLADKLLALLAAAPVLALQGAQQSLTRERPRQ